MSTLTHKLSINRMGPRIFVTVALLTCLAVLGTAAQSLSTLEDVLSELQDQSTRQQADVFGGRLRGRLINLADRLSDKAPRVAQASAAAEEAVVARRLAAAMLEAEPQLLSVELFKGAAPGAPPLAYLERKGRRRSLAAASPLRELLRECAGRVPGRGGAAGAQPPNCQQLGPLLIRSGARGNQKEAATVDIAVRLGRDPLAVTRAADQPLRAAPEAGDVWAVLRAESPLVTKYLADTTLGLKSLYDDSGARLSRTETPAMARRGVVLTTKQIKAFLAAGKDRAVLTIGTRDAPALGVVTRLRDVGDLVHVVTVEPSAMYLRLSTLRSDLFFSGIAFLLIALLLAFELARRISAPLLLVTKMTKSIAGGALDVRVKVRGVDEIVSLGSSVNEMAERIARLMSDACDAGRMAAELETARLVHELIFPPADVSLPGFSAHAFSRSASECCGDLWGTMPLPNGRTMIFIADASGHGVSSAFVTVAARAAFSITRTMLDRLTPEAAAGYGPAMLLSLLNQAVFEVGHGRVLMTMFLAVIDPTLREICYANAGHHFPYLMQRAADAAASDPWTLRSLLQNGNLLGLERQLQASAWTQAVQPYHQGDKLALFSDGIIDNCDTNGARFGRRRLKTALGLLGPKPGAELCAGFRDVYRQFASDTAPLLDDCTLVVLDLHGDAAGVASGPPDTPAKAAA